MRGQRGTGDLLRKAGSDSNFRSFAILKKFRKLQFAKFLCENEKGVVP